MLGELRNYTHSAATKNELHVTYFKELYTEKIVFENSKIMITMT